MHAAYTQQALGKKLGSAWSIVLNRTAADKKSNKKLRIKQN